jgi:hypothetical protein
VVCRNAKFVDGVLITSGPPGPLLASPSPSAGVRARVGDPLRRRASVIAGVRLSEGVAHVAHHDPAIVHALGDGRQSGRACPHPRLVSTAGSPLARTVRFVRESPSSPLVKSVRNACSLDEPWLSLFFTGNRTTGHRTDEALTPARNAEPNRELIAFLIGPAPGSSE